MGGSRSVDGPDSSPAALRGIRMSASERFPARDVRLIQGLLAAPFLGLGGWCLVAPGQIERLALRPEFVIDTLASHVLIGCFGAQAMLCGLLIVLCRFSRRGFVVFGLVGSVPFLGFNVWFTLVEPLFTRLMLLDVAGNLAILVLCLAGAARTPGSSR